MRPARALIVVPVIAGMLAACGGGEDRAAAGCDDTSPGPGATFATAGVAFAAREGEEVQSDRGDGYLPWFAKFGLYVRGRGDVVIRVPAAQRDEVNMAGWGGDPPRTDLHISASRCWTGYPGGLVFTGHRCVRLEVEGPGALRGAARFGLRRDCGEGTEDFFKKYQARAQAEGVDPLGYYLGGWGNAYISVLGDAIKGTNSLDDNKIADYIAKTEFKTIHGPIKFGAGGEWAKSGMMQVQYHSIKQGAGLETWRGMDYQTVLTPDQYKTGTIIYPYEKAK